MNIITNRNMPNRNDHRGYQGYRRPFQSPNNRGRDEKGGGEANKNQNQRGGQPPASGPNVKQEPTTPGKNAKQEQTTPGKNEKPQQEQKGGQQGPQQSPAGQQGPQGQQGGQQGQQMGGQQGRQQQGQAGGDREGGPGAGPGGRGGGNQPRGEKRGRPFQGGPSQAPGRRGGDQNRQNPNDTLNPLPEMETGPRPEKKFTGRCRLFVGNLANDISEKDFKEMFEKYGEVSETFLQSQKGFGFIRLDTRLNAEAAKAALDGTAQKGRTIRVRFATHGAALKVKNIPSSTSNELLEQAFSMFGEVERAIVIVDDRGRPTKEGIVEFARKPGAQNALTKIRSGVFLLTASPFPISVEQLEQVDEEDGNPERYIQKNREYHREREQGPRFAQHGSFEYEWGLRMKALEDEERLKRQTVEKDIEESRLKCLDEMELAKHEHQTMVMRQELLRRQEELQQLEEQSRQFQMRRNERDQRRRQEEELFRQQQEEAMRRRQAQQEDMRMQQQDMLRRQEEMLNMGGVQRQMQGGAGGPSPLMGAGAKGGQGQGNQEMMQQQQGNGAGRPSRFDQGPGFNQDKQRAQAGMGGANNQAQQRGGPGAPGVLGNAPGQQGGNQAGRGGPQAGGRGPGANQGGPNNGPQGVGFGNRGPNRGLMDDARGRMAAVERRDLERAGMDRPRMDRARMEEFAKRSAARRF